MGNSKGLVWRLGLGFGFDGYGYGLSLGFKVRVNRFAHD